MKFHHKKRRTLGSIVKEIFALVIRISGIPFLLRKLYVGEKVTIIVYHDPDAFTLDKHFKYLKENYNFVSLDNLVDAVTSGRWADLPDNSIVVAFDDGHKGNFELLNIFKKYNIRPTIYLCSQMVDTNRHFWWKQERINRKSLVKKLKKQSDNKRLDFLKGKAGYEPDREYLDQERQALSKDEICGMKDFVDFGSHSRFHPVLTMCDRDKCEEEIVMSKKEVEELVGKECKHFSYPNGDYSRREIDIIKNAGYSSARTVDFGWNKSRIDPFKLKVIEIADDASINWFVSQLSGLTWWLAHFFWT